jgi:hypothetical protein
MAQNVVTKVEGKVLTITVDLGKSLGISKSGKSTLIASTEGNMKLGDVTVGLNVFKPVATA